MVSLENKISYLDQINESPKLIAFHNLLLEKGSTHSPNIPLSEADESFLKVTSFIQENNKKGFEDIYARKSKSNPDKDSPLPFVNDDFLIFSLIVGTSKFDIDKDWIKKIISIRTRTAVTVTLENILNENYLSKDNLPEVVLMYLQLINPLLITNDILNITYKNVSENTTLFENKNDFQTLCALSAYDLTIKLKDAFKGSNIYLLKKFDKQFNRRIKYLSWIVQILAIAILLYSLLNLPKYSPQIVELIDKYNYVFTILGALGFTFIGNQIPLIRNKSRELLMRLFGYPKELLKKNLEDIDSILH